MGISKEAEARITEKKKTFDQAILDPNIFIKDFPLDPWTPYLKTNNFVQQTISRMLGYSESEEKWVRLKIDADGRLITTTETDYPSAVALTTRSYKEYVVASAVSVPAGGTLTHVGVDVNDYSRVTVLVSSSGNSTVYLQASDDNTSFYDIKAEDDSDLTWNCNAEKIAIKVPCYTHYLRVVVYATTASTVSVVVMCQV